MKTGCLKIVAIITIVLLVLISIFCLNNSKNINDGSATNKKLEIMIDSPGINYYKPLFENKQNVEVFLSPTGNDSCIGDKAHPLATAEKARDVLRLIKTYNRQRNKTYSVIFLEGTYFFKKTLVLNYSDSGKSDSPVIYKGEKGKIIIISGGVNMDSRLIEKASEKLPDWNRLDSVARGKIRMIDLKKLGITDYGSLSRRGFALPLAAMPLELFINDHAMTLARWPNESLATIDEVNDSLVFQCNTDHLKRWVNETDMWATGFWKWGWAEYSLPIKSIDVLRNRIHLSAGPRPQHNVTKGNQWFAYNILPELDTAGEYYIDRQSGWMYFIPPDDVEQSKMKISVSIFGNENKPLWNIDSTQNITIQNIIFEDTRASGITIENSNHINIENCTIKNIGTYAISLQGENCHLSDLSVFNTGAYGICVTGGIRKKLTKANNCIDNCIIHDIGRINFSQSCAVSLHGVGNVIRNCEIYNSPDAGINFEGNYHIIEKNKIHNVCLETDDAGAVYCGRDWALCGNSIRYNFIYNIMGSKYIKYNKGLNAIYLDDGASGISVFGNILYNIQCSGVFNGGGRDNKIENNIFVNCRWAHRADRRGQLKTDNEEMYKILDSLDYKDPPWSVAFPELAKMSKFKTNISDFLMLEYIVFKFPKLSNLLGIRSFSDLDPEGCVFSRNLIWKNRSKESLSDSRTSLAKRQGPFKFYKIECNLENNDPLFVNEATLNLDLLDNSPAYTIPCFERIPFEQIGHLKMKPNQCN